MSVFGPNMIFQTFFNGRQRDAAFPCTASLDDALYLKLITRYASEIAGKWGVGSNPTKAGFEEWLQNKIAKEVSNG